MVISAAEQALGIPRQLLAAIARVESGRWIAASKAGFAWPWTVTANGVGHYYETKEQATAAVHEFRARGITNIDVGCLQINLQSHPQAFHSIDAALDPMENTIYGALLLKNLHRSSGSWTSATARYHSEALRAGSLYVAKVDRLWYEEAKRAARTLLASAGPLAESSVTR
jgi:soluble lytic murein transglycosylase-like protein